MMVLHCRTLGLALINEHVLRFLSLWQQLLSVLSRTVLSDKSQDLRLVLQQGGNRKLMNSLSVCTFRNRLIVSVTGSVLIKKH